MQVDLRFRSVADRFFTMFQSPGLGGGALAAYLHGQRVLDIWARDGRRGAPSAFAPYP